MTNAVLADRNQLTNTNPLQSKEYANQAYYLANTENFLFPGLVQ
jgi:hypothetical protein